MKVRLDGDWEKLAGTAWDGEEEGTIELALYRTEKLTRLQIFCWLPDTAYECNLVFPTTDWSEAFSMLTRVGERDEILEALIFKALIEVFGETEAEQILQRASTSVATGDNSSEENGR